jgi:hypothetical protein
MSKAVDMTGRRFGRLEVVTFAYGRPTPSGSVKKFWLCRCDCGGEALVWGAALQSGETKSCGCLRREAVAAKNRSHGMSGTPEYKAWSYMKRRCLNPNSAGYENYGARGVSVCDRWVQSFEAFLADVGPRPSPQHSIERDDVDGNYEPRNVRWATYSEQMNNLRKSVKITMAGQTRTVAEWARLLKINPFTIYDRLDAGWDPIRALSEPVRSRPKR